MKHISVAALSIGVVIIIIWVIVHQQTLDDTWTFPSKQVVPTIFFQGITESQLQVMRYISDTVLKTTTDEFFKRSATKYIPIIHTPWVDPELPEIVPYRPAAPAGFITQRIHNFFHKLTETRRKDADISHHEELMDYSPHESLSKYSMNIEKVNIAQQDDIAHHLARYYTCIDHFGEVPIICHGVSRGAAATFNALCTHADIYKEHVQAVVLESPFDSIPEIFKQRFPYKHRIITWLLAIGTKYNNDGPFPIQLAHKFPADVPVLFITSAVDVMVPPERTEQLAQTLANQEQNDVYIVKLSASRHARYAFDQEDDARIYRDVVHAFYKKYQLPHIPRYAREGMEKLESCKLTKKPAPA